MNNNVLFFRGACSISFSFFIFSLSYCTHISQYGMLSFSLFPLQLQIQYYSPWSIQVISVLAQCLQWLLKAPRIKFKLLPWLVHSDTFPSTVLLQRILTHHSPRSAPSWWFPSDTWSIMVFLLGKIRASHIFSLNVISPEKYSLKT